MQSNHNEKIQLISKIMDSYMMEIPKMSDHDWWDKFNRLYEMEFEALKYLAELLKIKKNKGTFVEY